MDLPRDPDSTPGTPGSGEGTGNAAERLRRTGLSSTPQRRAILRALGGRTDHPSVDDLFETLEKSDAGISRTTVYRTLEAFVEAGLVQRVGHLEGGSRFDPRTEPHDHFLCEDCGSIRDLDPGAHGSRLQTRLQEELVRGGCIVSQVSLLLRGRCERCTATTD